MNINYTFQIRVTGILMENDKILLVKQKLQNRNWSLPGGRVKKGELLEEAMVREINEETGIKIKIQKLLFICDKSDSDPPIIHITFLLEKVGGKISLPNNEFDENLISGVQMVPIDNIIEYGFTEKFKEIIKNNFKDAGKYMELKANIGL